jgi:hypothetical protein
MAPNLLELCLPAVVSLLTFLRPSLLWLSDAWFRCGWIDRTPHPNFQSALPVAVATCASDVFGILIEHRTAN